ncbi:MULTISPECIES: DeoR/GlpR family DNA-binding transcription regulator [Pseudomonas]|uniref:DNA-binding transcriptional regulator of sugar metabolism, DeoR/GlpR family n=2 Tax=Pseudomonas TaxID=286 RepID=A0ABY0YG32_9PSED|nr:MULTISPECIES: DeoR/GlpR family DNA-binding transcription regulator [Pseudomonas]EPJ77743.1 transcriptional regulator, DeoR family protein [Pseudomonas sp. CFII68]MCP1457148.1 DeoR/GlpR family transcriptional regulator of sugar metabolism [Pseudomonas kilonensis]UVM59732.1 DeoR/GlpR family DNA-binding transcription regulator [Pseudomonas sp. B21-010]WPN61854.1 DeoR/GlpR family DNA-binding transcription regulator [Pseudomonas sp. P9_32]WPN67609.1 DeoR/GlpR family DNA-binding transcription reg
MWQEERYQRIRALLSTLQRVTTDRIVTDLNVSRETVRRDLVALEEQGELKRIHGGAIRVEDEAPIAERAQSNVKFKRDLARAAVSLLSHGQTVFIDAGTTTVILAEELAKLGGLTVITNSFNVALQLRNPAASGGRHNEVLVLGGSLDDRAPATVGSTTVAEIARYRADLALLSPVGIDAQRGASNYDHREAEVARAMADNAEGVVILADYSKIGVESRVAFCPPERIDVLITNHKASTEAAFAALNAKLKRIVLV